MSVLKIFQYHQYCGCKKLNKFILKCNCIFTREVTQLLPMNTHSQAEYSVSRLQAVNTNPFKNFLVSLEYSYSEKIESKARKQLGYFLAINLLHTENKCRSCFKYPLLYSVRTNLPKNNQIECRPLKRKSLRFLETDLGCPQFSKQKQWR